MSKDSLSVALSDIHLAKLRNFDLVDTSLDVLLKKFEYLHKLSKTDASGKEIHEFLSTNNLLNSDQNLFLDKHCQRCTPYSLYVNRIETELSNQAYREHRSQIPFYAKVMEFFQEVYADIDFGKALFWLLMLLLSAIFVIWINSSSQSVDSQFMINCKKQFKTESECRGIEKSNQKFERDMDEILNNG